MREYFKYEFGYINIDEENLYLTNSGNWSEVKNLSEKYSKKYIHQNARRIRIIAFFVICIILFAYLFISNLFRTHLAIGLVVLGYFLYRYLQSDMGQSFLIPINKIDSIEKSEKNLVLSFRNKENSFETIIIKNTDGKSEQIIKKFSSLHSIPFSETKN